MPGLPPKNLMWGKKIVHGPAVSTCIEIRSSYRYHRILVAVMDTDYHNYNHGP